MDIVKIYIKCMQNPWDERYAGTEWLFGTLPNDWLAHCASQLSPNSRLLSIGEGEGRNAVWLATQGHSVHALDASEVGLAKTNQWAKQNGVTVQTQALDLAEWEPQTQGYHAIVSIFCHLPPELRRETHRKVVDALAPRGWFILEAYAPSQLGRGTGGPSRPDMLYDLDDLRKDVAGLEIITLQAVERNISEGSAHNGISSVVQLLAKAPN